MIWVHYMDKKQKVHRTSNLDKGFQLWRKNLWQIEDTIGRVRISTIFIPFDLAEGINRKPYLFETALFRGKKSEVIGRYQSLTEAKKGHKKWLAELIAQSEETSAK